MARSSKSTQQASDVDEITQLRLQLEQERKAKDEAIAAAQKAAGKTPRAAAAPKVSVKTLEQVEQYQEEHPGKWALINIAAFADARAKAGQDRVTATTQVVEIYAGIVEDILSARESGGAYAGQTVMDAVVSWIKDNAPKAIQAAHRPAGTTASKAQLETTDQGFSPIADYDHDEVTDDPEEDSDDEDEEDDEDEDSDDAVGDAREAQAQEALGYE